MNERTGFLDIIMSRRSVRDFRRGDVSPEDLERILRAGTMAPSAGNRQPWRFHVIRAETKARFVEVLRKMETIPPQLYQVFVRGIETVPLVIGVENSASDGNGDGIYPNSFKVIGESKLNIGFLGSLLGVAASIENMLLAAHSLGYGAVWMSLPPILEAAEKVIKIPGALVAVLPVGRPADLQMEYVNRSRKPVEQITTFYE